MPEANRLARQELADERRAAIPAFGGNSGVTVRDYFAAAALTGLASAFGNPVNAENLATHAYQVADEMLKRRPA
jgi:hypothetical protein